MVASRMVRFASVAIGSGFLFAVLGFAADEAGKPPPSSLHDGRLLTLDDTVEFFNLVTGVKLTAAEKKDLVAFMRQL